MQYPYMVNKPTYLNKNKKSQLPSGTLTFFKIHKSVELWVYRQANFISVFLYKCRSFSHQNFFFKCTKVSNFKYTGKPILYQFFLYNCRSLIHQKLNLVLANVENHACSGYRTPFLNRHWLAPGSSRKFVSS